MLPNSLRQKSTEVEPRRYSKPKRIKPTEGDKYWWAAFVCPSDREFNAYLAEAGEVLQ